ncbi:hypothetical protein V9T40_003432 [Parthenolecanium corni]|uniref:Uncharacterized protein n=1 Tax=Parthenolecanium corni TaxID=536013 RepID=A0AAN9TSQ9_9HEMI
MTHVKPPQHCVNASPRQRAPLPGHENFSSSLFDFAPALLSPSAPPLARLPPVALSHSIIPFQISSEKRVVDTLVQAYQLILRLEPGSAGECRREAPSSTRRTHTILLRSNSTSFLRTRTSRPIEKKSFEATDESI